MRDDLLAPPTQAEVFRMVLEIHQAVFGNGHPERGLLIRLDRIEQRNQLLGRIISVLVPLVIAALSILAAR